MQHSSNRARGDMRRLIDFTAVILAVALSACSGGSGGRQQPQSSPAPDGSALTPGTSPSTPGTGSPGAPPPSTGTTDTPAPGTPAPGTPVAPPAGEPGMAALNLPLELLGDGNAPLVQTAVLNLDPGAPAGATSLAFTCHRCAFTGAPEWETSSRTPTRIKASVRVLGGQPAEADANVPWVDITDANVNMPAHERLQGGLGVSGLYTVRVQLALDPAARTRLTDATRGNRVQFRFNGTDGESNGLRIIKVDFLDANGKGLSTNPVVQADIGAQKRAALGPADVAAGKALWYKPDILSKSSIVARKMHASCASCHADSGRDLQYFNYSDNAIVQRSRFHGLSEQQGRQIAAFVRSNPEKTVHVAQAAPWNPPYQPGPGLDGRDVREWAAGAGLDAVLDDAGSVLNALVEADPHGKRITVTQAMIDRLMDPRGSHNNTRETAVSLQFPDWNAWLPAIAPEDVWPDELAGGTADFKGSFNQGAAFSGDNAELKAWKFPKKRMQELDTWLAANQGTTWGDWSHLSDAKREEGAGKMGVVGWEVMWFGGGGRGNKMAPSGKWGGQVGGDNLKRFASADLLAANKAAGNLGTSDWSFIERAILSARQWSIVNQWNLVQKYGLEGDQKSFVRDYGSSSSRFLGKGEKRGWALQTAGTFWVAAHVANSNDFTEHSWIFQWEDARDKTGAMYRNNIWYDLAMVLQPNSSAVIDWPYHAGLTNALIDATRGKSKTDGEAAMGLARGHLLRQLQIKAKTGQAFTNRTPVDQMTDTLMQLMPSAWIIERLNVTSRFQELNALQPDLYPLLVGGVLYQYNQIHGDPSGWKLADWRRCDPNADIERTDLDPYNRRKLMPYDGIRFCLDPQRGPSAITRPNGEMINWMQATTYDALLFSVLKGEKLGADPGHVANLMEWIDKAWPGKATSADMQATLTAPATASVGQEITLSMTCRNLGNGGYNEADGTAVTARCGVRGLPGDTATTATACSAGSLASGAAMNCTIKFRPTVTGSLALIGYANSHSHDPTPSANGEDKKTVQVN